MSRGDHRRTGLRATGILLVMSLAAAAGGAEPARGPLRRLEANPRYFSDGSGRAVLLVGSHNWHSFQDNGHRQPEGLDPAPAFDYGGYLDFLGRHGHNFFRLWHWETPRWTDAQPKRLCQNPCFSRFSRVFRRFWQSF